MDIEGKSGLGIVCGILWSSSRLYPNLTLSIKCFSMEDPASMNCCRGLVARTLMSKPPGRVLLWPWTSLRTCQCFR